VEAYPRVRALVNFYTTLYDVEVAKEELIGVKGMLRYAMADEKPVAQGIVDAQRVALTGLSELLVMRLIAANDVIPKWKSFSRYSDLLNANGSSNENTNPNESASPIVPPKPIAKKAAAAPKPVAKKAAPKAAVSAAGYKPIISPPSKKPVAAVKAVTAVTAVAAPPPIKKMNAKKGLKLFANLNNLSENSNNSATRKKQKAPVPAAPVAPVAPAATKKSRRLAPANNE
jgi:hypothetical protein